jgi:hypothetical protein
MGSAPLFTVDLGSAEIKPGFLVAALLGMTSYLWRRGRVARMRSTGLKTGHYKSRLEAGGTKRRWRRKVAATKRARCIVPLQGEDARRRRCRRKAQRYVRFAERKEAGKVPAVRREDGDVKSPLQRGHEISCPYEKGSEERFLAP